jgi:hypothetical protein
VRWCVTMSGTQSVLALQSFYDLGVFAAVNLYAFSRAFSLGVVVDTASEVVVVVVAVAAAEVEVMCSVAGRWYESFVGGRGCCGCAGSTPSLRRSSSCSDIHVRTNTFP